MCNNVFVFCLFCSSTVVFLFNYKFLKITFSWNISSELFGGISLETAQRFFSMNGRSYFFHLFDLNILFYNLCNYMYVHCTYTYILVQWDASTHFIDFCRKHNYIYIYILVKKRIILLYCFNLLSGGNFRLVYWLYYKVFARRSYNSALK